MLGGSRRLAARLRVAWSADFGFDYGPVDPEVQQAVASAAARFAELGCEVDDARRLGWSGPMEIWNTILYGGIVGQLGDDLDRIRRLLDPGLVRIVEEYNGDSLRAYVQAEFARNAFWDQVRQLFERYDLLLTPTVPMPAFALMRNTPGPVPGRLVEGLGWSFFTYPFNLTGQPAASIPCGFTADGLPIGLQLVGRRHADAVVLGASAAFEAAAPWQTTRPAIA